MQEANFCHSQPGQPRVVTPLSASPYDPATLLGSADGPQMMGNMQDPLSNPSSYGPAEFILPQTQQARYREHDLYMPIANVVRIMRQALPPHAKVADDAKEMLQACVSEFISFITSEANETCRLEHRKTITAEDVIWSMLRLGFDRYVDPLSAYLQRYRESEFIIPTQRRGASFEGNFGGATMFIPTPNGMPPPVTARYATINTPPFVVVHHHHGTGAYYQDADRQSTMLMSTGLDCEGVATVCECKGPSLALRIGDVPGGSEDAGPQGSPLAGLGFYDP